MIKQTVFIFTLFLTLGVFIYTIRRLFFLLKITQKAYPVNDFGRRIIHTIKIAFFQTKILRKPLTGTLHALVFWGFCVICIGSIEMVIDGCLNIENSLSILGPVYNVLTASNDIFGYLIALLIVIFIIRRVVIKLKRFNGIEMTHKAHRDANFSLILILTLMLSLVGMNLGYLGSTNENVGLYPISSLIISPNSSLNPYYFHFIREVSWWIHILLVFFFANYLPYSKHFHVFMSIPNVFLSRLEPLGKLPIMENVYKEVKLMMDPNLVFSETSDNSAPSRFGIKDIEDISWKNFVDSLTCTQCGRCTAVCPANITGKKLSPRKLFIDVRQRMNEKGNKIIKQGKDYSDNKSLINDYISTEELWACTTCNACATECPVNINHPTLILDMRRYLVMEEAAGPAGLNAIFSNIENNGAPWQYSSEDRLNWTL
ncbi:MAG: hypothetical protein A2033_03410 [Bacteroidetes bacterium GWA2_31_9]|nr:MAG: hypothetical protein A2033_03410 [Bacteroidetes bacterium GWA2_31_9]